MVPNLCKSLRETHAGQPGQSDAAAEEFLPVPADIKRPHQIYLDVSIIYRTYIYVIQSTSNT